MVTVRPRVDADCRATWRAISAVTSLVASDASTLTRPALGSLPCTPDSVLERSSGIVMTAAYFPSAYPARASSSSVSSQPSVGPDEPEPEEETRSAASARPA